MIPGKKELRSIIAQMKKDEHPLFQLDTIIRSNITRLYYEDYIRNQGSFACIYNRNERSELWNDFYDRINMITNIYNEQEASYSCYNRKNGAIYFKKFNYLSPVLFLHKQIQLNHYVGISQLVRPEYIAILMKDGSFINTGNNPVKFNFYKNYNSISQNNFSYVCAGAINNICLHKNNNHYQNEYPIKNYNNRVLALYDGFKYEESSMKSRLTIKDIVTIMDASVMQLHNDIISNLEEKFRAKHLQQYNLYFNSDYIQFLEENQELLKYNAQPFYVISFPIVLENDILTCDHFSNIKIIFYPFLKEAVLYSIVPIDNSSIQYIYKFVNLISRNYDSDNCEKVVREMIDYYHEKLDERIAIYCNDKNKRTNNYYYSNRKFIMPVLTDYTMVLVGNILHQNLYSFKDEDNRRLTFYYQDPNNYMKAAAPTLINSISDFSVLKYNFILQNNARNNNEYTKAIEDKESAHTNYMSIIRNLFINFKQPKLNKCLHMLIKYYMDNMHNKLIPSQFYISILPIKIRVYNTRIDSFSIDIIFIYTPNTINRDADINSILYKLVNSNEYNGLTAFTINLNSNITYKNINLGFAKDIYDINNSAAIDKLLYDYYYNAKQYNINIHNLDKNASFNTILAILKEYFIIALKELQSSNNFIELLKEAYNAYIDIIHNNENIMRWKEIYDKSNMIIKQYEKDIGMNELNDKCNNININEYENLKDLETELLYYFNSNDIIRIDKFGDE